MSTPFYDLASLVVVPSGYKASKVYAQKPLTTDGQLTFSRASTATRVNASGLIETVSSNVPRLDYLGSTCPKLLLEPSRTNVLTYNSEFDNAAWNKENITVTANAIASPSGATNADKIEATGTVGCYVNTSSSNSGVYTHSVYAKAGNVSSFTILWASYNSGKGATFNLSNGTVTVLGATVTATITAVGNGWYRCTTTDTSANYIFLLSLNNPINTAITSGSFIYIWGTQAEAGAYATSLINTTTAAVTRLADACSKTGISSLIGQTAGTVFVEYKKTHAVEAGGQILVLLADNSNPAATRLQVVLENDYTFLYVVSGSTLLAQSSNISIANGVNKIAFSYGANGYKFYVNGVQQFSNSTTTVPATQNLFVGNYTASTAYLSDAIAQTLLFKTQLTNAQLAELTTL